MKMNILKRKLSQPWRWLSRLVSDFDPFRLKELERIQEKMKFWHEEERRTMQEAFAAFDRGDMDEYSLKWEAHKYARNRCDVEVRQKLETFKR